MDKERFDTIVSDAIEGEAQAQDYYFKLSKRASDPQTASLFEALSKQERTHRDILLKILEQKKVVVKLGDLPDVSSKTAADDVTYSDSMSYREAISMAIKKEEEATDLYLLLAESNTDPEIIEIFTSLAKHEASHKRELERLFETGCDASKSE